MNLRNALTHGFDHAGGIGARRIRQRRLDGISSIAHVGVVGIHARGMHAHQHLPGRRLGRRDLLQLQNFRPAELVHLYRFHQKSPPCVQFRESLDDFIAE